MGQLVEKGDTGPGLYDVQLRCGVPDSVRSRFPALLVGASEAQTALRRRVSGAGQLDALLERLRSVGLVLIDVHRASEGAPSTEESGTYEVRVEGELSESLLHYLHWPYSVIPAQTTVRLEAGSVDLNRFLQACTEGGAGIESVRRVDQRRADVVVA